MPNFTATDDATFRRIAQIAQIRSALAVEFASLTMGMSRANADSLLDEMALIEFRDEMQSPSHS